MADSEGNSTLEGTRIVSASGSVQVLAGQNIDLLAVENSAFVEETFQSWDLFGSGSAYMLNHKVKDQVSESSTTLVGASLTGASVQVVAGGNLHAVAATIQGAEATSLAAGGSVLVEAGLESFSSLHDHRESGFGWNVVKTAGLVNFIGFDKNFERQGQDAATQSPLLSVIGSAHGSVAIAGGVDVALLGAQLDAAADVRLTAGQHLLLGGALAGESHGVRDEDGAALTKMRDGSAVEAQSTTVVPGVIRAGGEVRLDAGALVTLGAVDITSGGATVFATPALDFVGERGSDYLSRTLWDKDIGYEVNQGNGRVVESLRLATIDARGGVQVPEATQVSLELDGQGLDPAGNAAAVAAGEAQLAAVSPAQFQALAGELALQPGMAYLADLLVRPVVDWRAVSTAHQNWDYKTQGLTQAGAIVLTVVVAIVAAPAAEAVEALVGGTGTIVATAASAGFTSLAASAAVSFVNNGGDLGKTLHDLGSSQSVKNLVTSMLTAGLVKGVTNSLSLPSPVNASFADRFKTYAVQATVRAGVLSAVQGRPLSETMKTALIDSLAQSLTSEIGDWGDQGLESGSLAKIIAHGVVQCAAASIADKDCASAALGGVVSEGLAPFADAAGDWGRAITSLGAVLAASLLDKDVDAAFGAAEMVDTFNRQLHPNEVAWLKAKAKLFAKEQGISEEVALSRLTQQALRQVDYLWRAQLRDGDDRAAQAVLDTANQSFVNDLGDKQSYFTAPGQQLFRPEMFAEVADPGFYKRYAQSGIQRTLSAGLAKELKDSGIDLANGTQALVQAAIDHPDAVLRGIWKAIKGLPDSVVDGLKETGQALGEGGAVAFNDDLTQKLNAIYGVDVSTAQKTLLTLRISTALLGTGSAAKVGGKTAQALDKQLGEALNEAAKQALLKRAGNSGKDMGTAGAGVAMNSGGDRLIGAMGPARVNNSVEYNAIVNDLKANGVDISYREGQFAYGPAPSGGRPGNIVFDPNASLSAIQHEYGHFLDDAAQGFPGQRFYYENPSARLATERSQYIGEIRTARDLGDTTARRQLIEDYLGEKKYLIDNYYTKPYGSN